MRLLSVLHLNIREPVPTKQTLTAINVYSIANPFHGTDLFLHPLKKYLKTFGF